MSYTPGPWIYRNEGTEFSPERRVRPEATAEHGGLICNMPDGMVPDTVFNARLLAAAPDLLEALEYALDEICTLCRKLNPQHINCVQCLETDSIREAIRKARGE